MEDKLFHFVCLSGILAKMSFRRIIFYFSLVDLFHPQNMFLFHVLGLCFEGVRDSLLLLILFFFCVLVFGTQPSFGPLVSCACILWIRCLLCSSSSLLSSCVSACVVFFYGFWFVCSFSILVVILGLSFLDCSVLMLLIPLHVLAARLSLWVFGLPFYGNPPRGSYGYGQPGGVNIFFGFSHNRGVWVKTGAAPQGEGFANFFYLKNVHLRAQNRRPFAILSQEMLQI